MLRWRLGLFGFICLASASQVLAHPHIWIDSYFQINLSSTKVQTLETNWQFDVFSSTDMLIEFDKDGSGQLEGVEKADAAKALTNLAQYQYFLRLQVDGQEVTPADVQVVDVGIKDQALTVKLGVTLPQTVDLQESTLRMGFGDPQNYFALVTPEDGLLKLTGMMAELCTPTPADAEEFYMEGWVDLHCDAS